MSIQNTIAKNSLFLYVRMLLRLGVSLYTSRVVLDTLGVDDFGIYNLVGGIVVLFSFINMAMTGSTQRFLNIEMSKNSNEALRKVFCVSMNCHIIIMVIIIIIAETIGLWFLNNHLNIPESRMFAANIVYQFSILSFSVNILNVPYNASVVAHEKMSFYAWAGISEVLLKLMIVFMLLFFQFDKLILYAILTFGVTVVMFFLHRTYCLRIFSHCQYRYINDKVLFKKLLGFSGWIMLGQAALISSSQGLSMILNIFKGVSINAALGIAAQVNAAVYSFVSSFQVAFKPQIIKSYGANELIIHERLIFQASRISYFAMFIIIVPILFKTKYLLELWLKFIPDYTVGFTQVFIISSLFNAISGPFEESINATGKIRNYQIIISGLYLLNLPLAYSILLLNYSPIYALISNGLILFIISILRFSFVYQNLKFSLILFLKKTVWALILVSALSVIGTYFINKILNNFYNNFISIVIFFMLSIMWSISCIYFLGLSQLEKRRFKGVFK